MIDFLSGSLSVAADDFESNVTILTYSLPLWDLKDTYVISAHLCCALVHPLQVLLCLQTWTSLDCSITHCLFLTLTRFSVSLFLPSFSAPSLSPSLSVLFISDRECIGFGCNSFLSYQIRSFFLRCENFSTSREIVEPQFWELSITYSVRR